MEVDVDLCIECGPDVGPWVTYSDGIPIQCCSLNKVGINA